MTLDCGFYLAAACVKQMLSLPLISLQLDCLAREPDVRFVVYLENILTVAALSHGPDKRRLVVPE